MLLASDYDKSKYFKGTDLDREKKFRIKKVTADELTDRKGKKEKKLIVWFTNDERGLAAQQDKPSHFAGRFRRRHRRLGQQSHRDVSDDSRQRQPGLRVRILPPKQAAAAAPPTQPASPGGNGAAAVPPPPTTPAVVDPELVPDPPKLSAADEMEDEIPF